MQNETIPSGIVVFCNMCSVVLTEPGALFFSPPKKSGKVKKFHICKVCWKELRRDYSL